MHLLLDRRIDVVSTFWKDDDYKVGQALHPTITFTTSGPKLLQR
jgi:hypothetical protein